MVPVITTGVETRRETILSHHTKKNLIIHIQKAKNYRSSTPKYRLKINQKQPTEKNQTRLLRY